MHPSDHPATAEHSRMIEQAPDRIKRCECCGQALGTDPADRALFRARAILQRERRLADMHPLLPSIMLYRACEPILSYAQIGARVHLSAPRVQALAWSAETMMRGDRGGMGGKGLGRGGKKRQGTFKQGSSPLRDTPTASI